MTSLFDQFQQPSMKSTKNNNITNAEMSSSGYIYMPLEPDVPIFNKTRKDFTPSDKITHVAISNKQLVVVMANNILFRMNMHNPQQQDEISLTKYTNTNRLMNIYLDPTGNHLLLALTPKTLDAGPELLYLNRKSNKLKTTTKFRGHEFTEIAWNILNQSETNTGPILLGTSKGLIFETEIVLDGDKFFTSGFSSSLEQYWRQVFDIGKGANTPITGLEYYTTNQDRYTIIATTPTRFYLFNGRAEIEEKPLLQQIFNRYLNIIEKDTFIEFESNQYRQSRLKLWSENLTQPNAFVWTTEKGVCYSSLESGDTLKTIEKKLHCIPYPRPQYEDYSTSPKHPIALTLTQFHVLLAYTDVIKGVCILNDELVYEDNYNEAFGKLVNILKDEITGELWAVTENALFRFKITREERNVWKIFCDNRQFDLAKKYSRDNEAYHNQVLIKEADQLFEEGRYDESAQRYAETQSSFEEICLKFITSNQQTALKIFLTHKLDTLIPQDKTQITMIVIWIIEIYLSRLEELRLNNQEKSDEFVNLQKEFEKFLALTHIADCIRTNKTTIYDLMSSHGDKQNLMRLTILNKDFERLMRQHVYKDNYYEALDVLKSQNDKELYYQFAPMLIQKIPKHLIKCVIEQGRGLCPLKLLPALIGGADSELHAQEIIKYLEFAIETLKNNHKSLNNFLVSLYAKYNPKKLLDYLDKEGQELSLINYDVYFALRLCQEYQLTEACVHLSALLGMWEEAVELALDENVELAMRLADRPGDDQSDLRKKLWLKIAKYTVSGKNDIQQAMKFLEKCDLIKIEDILPFFHDFVTIEHFKEAICDSLKNYNRHIQDLNDEMEEATTSAEKIRNEIHAFRDHFTYLTTNDQCDICESLLMLKTFYVFPCQHRFHTDCMLNELAPTLGVAKKNKLADLERQLRVLNTQTNNDNLSTGSGVSARDLIRSEIDNIIASECIYCGETMIRNIDKPFIEDYEYESVMKEWE